MVFGRGTPFALFLVVLAASSFATAATIGVVSRFEGGSVGAVEHVSPTHLRCAVQGQSDQDHRNRQANWYYFELTNLPRQPVTIDLVALAGEYNYRSPTYSVTRDTRPVYSYDGVDWRHFTDAEVSWDPHEPHLTLHFTPERDHIWIAHVTPYTNKNLAELLADFKTSPYLQVQSVGHTVEGREMPLLTITDPQVPEAKKKVIWLMFRQHAWETGSSWAGDGAIRFLLSKDERAVRIRQQVIYKIFPLADPDGVADGGVRFNRNGYDLNRNWDTPNEQKMPEIWAQRKAMLGWVDSGHRFDLFLSLHNDETNEYLQAPADFHELGERVFRALAETTSFKPTSPLRHAGSTTTPGKPGRMTVDQGLYHDRHLPAMLMEQTVDYNSKLGRVPTVLDRRQFGAELARALAEAVTGADLYTSRIEEYFDQLVRESPVARDKAWNRDFSSLENYRASVAPNRADFIKMIGGFDHYVRVPLRPQIKRIASPAGYTVDRITLDSTPGVEAEGLLLIPQSCGGPCPAVIVQHGMGGTLESIAGLDNVDDSYHHIGRRLADQGFVVWVNRMTQGVETKSRLNRKAILVGQGLQALEEWNLIRVIDYLQTRPEVIPDRIAIYGKSWGGRTSLYTGAIDERIAAVVATGDFNDTVPKMLIPGPHYTAYIQTREDYAFYPNMANEFSHSDIASLICPRPLYIEQGDHDPVVWYPMAQREFEVVRGYYRRLGVEDRAQMEVFPGVHEIHGVGSIEFLKRWLMGPQQEHRNQPSLP